MDRIITDNNKVNENLLNEVNTVNKQNKELIVKNMDLQEQFLIQRVSNRRELLKHYSNFLYENGYLTKDNVLMEYELSLL